MTAIRLSMKMIALTQALQRRKPSPGQVFGKPVAGWGKLLGCPDLHVAMFDIVTPPLNPPTFGEAACACC
jgi:hypothetical protein